jgi:hypothetical protein
MLASARPLAASIRVRDVHRAYRSHRRPQRRGGRTGVVPIVTSQVLNASGSAFAAFALVSALFSLAFVVLIIVVVANRAEPDPRGLRPHSVYLFGMSFVTLQLTYAGLILIATSLFSLIAPHDSPLNNTVAREVVIGALFVVIAGGAWVGHVTRGIGVARGEDGVGPNARVMKSYAGVVGFIYFLQVIFAFGISIYLLLSLIAPGVFGSIGSSRSSTLAALLDALWIMFISGVAVAFHSSLGPSALPPRPARPAHAAHTAPPAAPPAAPAV